MSPPLPTIARDSDWADVTPTASRLVRLVPCPACGGLRMASPGPHSPRWFERGGKHVQVDCAGVEVTKEARR